MSEVDLSKLYVMVGRPLTREQFEEVTQSLKNQDGKVLFVEESAPAPGAEAAIDALEESLAPSDLEMSLEIARLRKAARMALAALRGEAK